MGLRQFMARQLRQPSGWFGSLVLARAMNSGNRRIMESTISLLDIRPSHNVLEIGFGGGAALALVAAKLDQGITSGLDLSPEMVRRAQHRFHKEVAAGRIRLDLGDISSLPYADAAFDRLFTINTIYFWSDLFRGLSEIRRVLKTDGRAAIAIRSKQAMSKARFTRHGFRLFAPDELANIIQQAGFRLLALEHTDQDKLYDQVICVFSS